MNFGRFHFTECQVLDISVGLHKLTQFENLRALPIDDVIKTCGQREQIVRVILEDIPYHIWRPGLFFALAFETFVWIGL
jgi:hypothetical protein